MANFKESMEKEFDVMVQFVDDAIHRHNEVMNDLDETMRNLNGLIDDFAFAEHFSPQSNFFLVWTDFIYRWRREREQRMWRMAEQRIIRNKKAGAERLRMANKKRRQRLREKKMEKNDDHKEEDIESAKVKESNMENVSAVNGSDGQRNPVDGTLISPIYRRPKDDHSPNPYRPNET